MANSRTYLLALVGTLGALVVTSAVAQQSVDGPHVLHEFVENTTGRSKGKSPSARARRQGQPPALSMEPGENEPLLDPDGPKMDGPLRSPYGPLNPASATNTLDDRTDRVSRLEYFANFEPSVIPYKRVVSQNRVNVNDGSYQLTIEAEPIIELGIESAQSGSELFWGSFLIRAESGRMHPLPSVAPNQKLVEIRSEPAVPLTFYKDRADNFFVRTNFDGVIRLNIRIAVPQTFFSGAFADVPWDQFQAIPVPDEARTSAAEVLGHIGVSKSTHTPKQALTKLVEYFRNFEARPFPDELRGDDRYISIAKNQIGVCRHRSLAFVITAQTLGMQTRYVYNEAHAFVEVRWPQVGWRRIDLGGAADELNAASDDGRSIHESGPDSLPEPEKYKEEQQRMETNFPSAESDGGSNSNDGTDSENVNPTGDPTNGDPTNNSSAPEPVDTTDERTSTALMLTASVAQIRRGKGVKLSATLIDENGVPLRDKNIAVYIGPAGEADRRDATQIGKMVTRADGRAVGVFKIPPDHAVGRWEIFAVFGGDKTHRPIAAQ